MKRTLFQWWLVGAGVAALAGCGNDVNGPASTFLSCGFGTPTELAPGEVLQVSGTGNQACLSAGGEAGDFVYIPFHGRATEGDDPARLAIEVTGGGLNASGPGADPARSAPRPGVSLSRQSARTARPVRDTRFHARLRQREIEELGPRIRPGSPRATAVEGPIAADVPAIGDLRAYNTAISCDVEDLRTGRVMYVSDHAVVVADTSNPTDLTPADYAYFGVTFDTLVYPVDTGHFGVPTDIDENGRSILFFTTAVNARNDHDNAESVVIGFFWSGDLFPEEDTPRLQACPGGNDAEMFYLIAPDPDGEVGVPFTLEDVREYAIPLIGHEYQHLINASRRLFVNNATTFEDSWLNEGLSHIAEELLFYEASGLSPLQNLDIEDLRASDGVVNAFNEYMGGNFNNFASYLSEPDTASLMGIDNLSTRGATWAFLRYAADRSDRDDADFFFDVVNGSRAGVDNLDDVLGPDETLDWMADWTVSVFGDDYVAGLPARYALRSWNLRSLYESSSLESYPLVVRTLASGGDRQVELLTGGASYMAFGLGADGPGAIHVESEGATPPSQLRGSFLRVR
ncbi:MAG: hypothetical protein P8177_00975 [Gemmatimonadota bacterium]